ncbi:MAG: Na(+)-translocating NADH-quinone reductase subunit A [Saprospiraceae bacterium]
MKVEAQSMGASKTGEGFGIIPSMDELFAKDLPRGVEKKDVHFLRQGFDISLQGDAAKQIREAGGMTYAVKPTNFIGMSPIPKVVPAVGETVQAGDVLFFDKKNPDVKYVAPVSGEVIEINRGEKRSIASIVILADKEISHKKHTAPALTGGRQAIVDFMLASGVWPMLRQRPYNVVASATDAPKSIFVSTFDTAPLAPDLGFVIQGRDAAFQKGLDVLNKLTPGHVHLGMNGTFESAPAFRNAQGVKKHYFRGQHPAGNVGVHIHHVDPVSASQIVWTAGVQDVITIGQLFLDGTYDATRYVAVTGAEVAKPAYAKTYMGAKVSDLLEGQLETGATNLRIVSGDVLSGTQVDKDDYLDFYDDQLTELEEGDYYEMFGWLLPIAPRPSTSGTFPNKLFGPDYKFKANTNSHGEKRAFVLTGHYEKVLPMDVLPQELMKAIMANDFERMEGLGIYELVEEDLAICEFTCVSKQPLQSILREGLDVMREQG